MMYNFKVIKKNSNEVLLDLNSEKENPYIRVKTHTIMKYGVKQSSGFAMAWDRAIASYKDYYNFIKTKI